MVYPIAGITLREYIDELREEITNKIKEKSKKYKRSIIGKDETALEMVSSANLYATLNVAMQIIEEIKIELKEEDKKWIDKEVRDPIRRILIKKIFTSTGREKK